MSAPIYSEEQKNMAVELAAQGKPLKEIIDAICTTEYHFYLYRQQYHDWNMSFERARQEGLEHMADGLITIADEYTDVQRARLKSDNAKWLLSKRKPSVYGDKVDIHVSQTIDITSALTEARKRTTYIDVSPVDGDPTNNSIPQLLDNKRKSEK